MNAAELAALFPAEAPEGAAELFLACRHAVRQKERELSEARAALAAAETDLLRRMDAASVGSVNHCGSTLTAVTTDSYGLTAQALEDYDLFRWLVASGGAKLVTRHVNPHSFSKFVRGLAASGRRVHPRVRTVTRRSVRVLGARDE